MHKNIIKDGSFWHMVAMAFNLLNYHLSSNTLQRAKLKRSNYYMLIKDSQGIL